jgi:hypothetical protein
MRGIQRLLALFALVVLGVKAQLEGKMAQQVVEDGAVKSVPLRTHSLYPPFLDADLHSRW